MKLVEQHTIRKNHKYYDILDNEAYKSKNLYNASLYAIRQYFFQNNTYLPYPKLQHIFQEEKQQDYYSLPTKVAQQTMRMVDKNFKSFFNSNKEFKNNPSKFKGKPKLPKYLNVNNGRYLLIYTSQAISKKLLEKEGQIKLSGINVTIPTQVKYSQLQQVRVVNRDNKYIIEVIYEDGNEPEFVDNDNYAAIDLGVTNFAAITTNIHGIQPFIIDGRNIKSINRYYNKSLSECKAILDTRNKGQKTSNKIRRLTDKRNNKIKDYLHKASRIIVNQLVSMEIGTVIVGHNKGWKQDTNIGKVNNQNFVQIPHSTFIKMLRYKCQQKGIQLKEVDESYTSKCSFLDNEEIRRHEKYIGKRITRGLFRTKSGVTMNADINGSYNIMRKCIPNAFANGVEGVLVHPRIIKILN